MYRYKTITKTKRCIVWLSVMLYFMAPLGATEGLVLCFGSDGHILVEPAPISYHCGHSSLEPREEASIIHAASGTDFSSSECTSCIDIPLFINVLGQSSCPDRNTLQLIKTPAMLTHASFQSSFANVVFGNSSSKPLFHDHSTLDSIRTTILLI